MKSYDLPLEEIDRKATKDRVESELERYRQYLLTEELDKLPKVTANYSLIAPTNTNRFHSSTEDTAIDNVDYQIKRRKFMYRVVRAVNRLSYKERAIIILRYMNNEQMFDYEVYNQLHMAERTYHRYKSKALYNLALALNVVEFKEKEDESAWTLYNQLGIQKK